MVWEGCGKGVGRVWEGWKGCGRGGRGVGGVHFKELRREPKRELNQSPKRAQERSEEACPVGACFIWSQMILFEVSFWGLAKTPFLFTCYQG